MLLKTKIQNLFLNKCGFGVLFFFLFLGIHCADLHDIYIAISHNMQRFFAHFPHSQENDGHFYEIKGMGVVMQYGIQFLKKNENLRQDLLTFKVDHVT